MKNEFGVTTSAKTWLGQRVEARLDSGWGTIPGHTGIVQPRRGWKLSEGWFNLITEECPEGIIAHTNEFYPPVRKEDEK